MRNTTDVLLETCPLLIPVRELGLCVWQENKRLKKPKGKSRMDNSESTDNIEHKTEN
jgi:hypothetical protein